MPNVARMAAPLRPEGGGGACNPDSGGFDALGSAQRIARTALRPLDNEQRGARFGVRSVIIAARSHLVADGRFLASYTM